MTSIKYPILGYAPGTYYCRCTTCGDQFTGDKKAVQCQPCAINTLSESHSLSLERIGELEKEVERLKGLIDDGFKRAYNLSRQAVEIDGGYYSEQCLAAFKAENNLQP